MQKVCFKCGQELPLDQFYRHKMLLNLLPANPARRTRARLSPEPDHNRLGAILIYEVDDHFIAVDENITVAWRVKDLHV